MTDETQQKYIVYGERTISFDIEIFANSEDEAEEQAGNTDLNLWNENCPTFHIYEVELQEGEK